MLSMARHAIGTQRVQHVLAKIAAVTNRHPLLYTESPVHSGPPDPWPSAVPMEPFSTSVFKDLA